MDNLLTHARVVLGTTPTRWQNLTAVLDPALFTRPPAPGEWSALECLQHLVDSEEFVFPPRVQKFLEGQDFAAFNPNAESRKPDRTPAELAQEFARLRAGTLAALARLTDADLPRTANHSELGKVTLGEMLHEWAAHDLMHTVQAERALMQPFIAGSGPWRKYFTDHDVEHKVRA